MRRKMKDSPLSERALGVGYQDDGQLRAQFTTNCYGVPWLDQALFDPGSTSQEIFVKLRSIATIYGDRKSTGVKKNAVSTRKKDVIHPNI
ncbi:hypothetical protein Golomagni_02878 [Golovinomyces magnicellulatus]|nr:hypothetical protein Golomagni_02878 [Golovinomyces magnicellulatus]